MAGPKAGLRWSPEAEADLADIWSYYAEAAGREVANSIVNKIGSAVRMLEDHPLAGRPRDEIRPGLRSVLAALYIVFYRVVDSVAEIARILHGHRDLDDIFFDDAT